MQRFLMFCMIFIVCFLPGSLSARDLMMATTTSTDNTGLLDYLAPKFEQDTGIDLKWTAVGTGKALEIGRNCDVDVLLVHAPRVEKRYVKNGYGVDRTQIMYNDFVIIGPSEDPANIRGKSVNRALNAICRNNALFVSRGDDSGTNQKELSLWKNADIDLPDRAKWYMETGQGMLSTIRISAERNGYTMTDRGTYIKYSDSFEGDPPLDILVQGDSALFNQYSVLAINPERCDNVKYDLARKFIEWIASDKIQNTIADYKLLGRTLFTPNAE
ncbi:MAG: substrate-binding domain-containing protein [Thermodesulfobacteriota bacterium]